MYFNYVNIFRLYENFLIFIWNFCEYFGINIGIFGPYIFNVIIGNHKSKRIK